MKRTIIKATLGGAASLFLLTACSENDWNDHLDGFKVPETGLEVMTVDYTLTDADYKTIANSFINKCQTDEEKVPYQNILSSLQFADEAEARACIPVLLESANFPYFNLSNGSNVRVSYRVASARSELVTSINNASLYTVKQSDYQDAWGSTTEFINGFAPMTSASSSLPAILKKGLPDAVEGDAVVVSYNETSVNPVFGGTTEPVEPFIETNVLDDYAEGDELTIRGTVTGVCNCGFVITDGGGSIFIYQRNGFSPANVPLYSLVEVKGTVAVYSTGYQIPVTDADYSVKGEGEFTFPTPRVYDGAAMTAACERTSNNGPIYATITGKVSVSGNYYNVTVDGTSYQASIYYAPDNIRAQVTDGGTYKLTGWFISVTGSAKYFNIVTNDVQAAGAANIRGKRRAASEVAVNEALALYTYDGSTWSVPAKTATLQPSDYEQMTGNATGYLSSSQVESYLPLYLDRKYPYAADEDEVTVAYRSSSSNFAGAHYLRENDTWNNTTLTTTEQFSKSNGAWQYNPSVTINLPSDKSQASKDFYQACVQWVYDNVCLPLGATSITGGEFWVSKYGNSEYWSGTSAYQTNVDIRCTQASDWTTFIANYYNGIGAAAGRVELIDHLLHKTFPGTLSTLYPDAKPGDGMDITYTINFVVYTPSRTKEEKKAVYKVVGNGEFEFVSSTLDAASYE